MWWMALTLSVFGVHDILCSDTDGGVLPDQESSCALQNNVMMARVDEMSSKVDEMSLSLNESLVGMTERLDRMSRSMVKMATVFMQLPEIIVQLKQQSKVCCNSKLTTEMPSSIQELQMSEIQILEELNNNMDPYEPTTDNSSALVEDFQIMNDTTAQPPIITQLPSKETGISNLHNPLDLVDSVSLPSRTTDTDLLTTTYASPSTSDIPFFTVSTESTTIKDPYKTGSVLTDLLSHIFPSISTAAPATSQPSTTKTSDSTTVQPSTPSYEMTPDTIHVQVFEVSNKSDLEIANGCQLGYFRVGYECFKAFKTKYTWEAANEKCAAEGLRMAEPRDPVGVADFLKDNIAPYYYWLGGRGDGTTFKWLTGPSIAATSLYWFSQYPVSLFSNCLIMLASHNFPTDVPFYAQPCNSNYFVLCQGANFDGQAYEEEEREPHITTKGIITWVTADDDDAVTEDKNTVPSHPIHIAGQHNKTLSIPKNISMNGYIIRGCDSEFHFIGSQCFIAYLDEKVSWASAQRKCASEGLVMAQPRDPVALAFYLRHYVASSPLWLGANGDGTAIKWLNSSVVEESSPLWYHNPSPHLDKCLMLLTNAYYQTPLYAERCFAIFYTLCQGNISASDVISKSDNAEPFIERSTTVLPENTSVTNKFSKSDDGETFIERSTITIPECTEEFFRVGPGCYKSITDVKEYTWDLASQKCRDEGLKLAEPENPIALANYLKNNVEPSYFWMGASADGWTFSWGNGSVIPASSRLWYRYQPSAAMGNCLLLMATTSLTNLAPLYDNPCNDLHYAVCQRID